MTVIKEVDKIARRFNGVNSKINNMLIGGPAFKKRQRYFPRSPEENIRLQKELLKLQKKREKALKNKLSRRTK